MLTPAERHCPACAAPIDALGALSTQGRREYVPRHVRELVGDRHDPSSVERKRVTVMFCDIVNSTALANRLGPERMHEFLSRFFDCALDCVHHYGGTVNQFLGDGFMALFGAPAADERHALHAVLAAFELRDALARPGAVQGQIEDAIPLRIGINGGLSSLARSAINCASITPPPAR